MRALDVVHLQDGSPICLFGRAAAPVVVAALLHHVVWL